MNGNVSNPDVAVARPPSRLFYGWWILVVCSLLAIFGGGLDQALTILVVPMRDDLSMSILSIGFIFTLAAGAGTVAGLLVGWLADRYGSRPLVLFGGLAAGAGLVLFSLADSYGHFLVTFAVAIAGMTLGFSTITLLSTVNRWFDRGRPMAMAVLMTGFAAAPVFVAPLAGVGLAVTDWRSVLVYTGVFLCALTAVGWLALRSRPEDKGLWPDGAPTPPTTPDFRVREAIRTGAFWALVLGGMVLNDSADTTVEDISPVLTAAMAVLAILLTFGLGVASGRIPPRKILSGALVIGALGHVALLVLDGDPGTVAFLSAMAVVQGGNAAYWIMVGDYFGRRRFASIMGVVILLRGAGAYVPGIIGSLLDTMGYYDFSLPFYFLLYAAIAVPLWFARRPSPPLPTTTPASDQG